MGLDQNAIADRFRTAFPSERPVRIEGEDGTLARIRVVSVNGGERSWIQVNWVPFGDADAEGCATIPTAFEGIPVSCFRTSDVPLTPEEHVMDAFVESYLSRRPGTIGGGDGMRARLVGVMLSTKAAARHAATYGCVPGEIAILADWVPADDVDSADGDAVFPNRFLGLPVYYLQGVAHVVDC